MKKIKNTLIKTMFPIFLSVLCSVTFSGIISNIYTNNLDNIINSRKIYILSKKYQDFNEMNQNSHDYLYYEKDNEYQYILGITRDIKNIDKIKKIYNTNLEVQEYQINNQEILEKLSQYDLNLSKESDQEKQTQIIDNTLKLYKEQKINLIINS